MIYHEYETIYVTRPELPEAETTRLTEKFDGLIADNKGSVLVHDDWGRKKLAYVVKKHSQGHYLYLNYVGPAELPRELERNFRIEDNLIRFLTVKLAENVDPEERRVLAEERMRKRREQIAREAAERLEREEARGQQFERREQREAREPRQPREEIPAVKD